MVHRRRPNQGGRPCGRPSRRRQDRQDHQRDGPAPAGGHVPRPIRRYRPPHLAALLARSMRRRRTGSLITDQTFVIRTPKHRSWSRPAPGGKGLPGADGYPKQPWLDGSGTGAEIHDIDYVFCTHLHIDHCGWSTRLVNGTLVLTFPNAKYVFHKRDTWRGGKANGQGRDPPGNVWMDNCRRSGGRPRRCRSTTISTLDDTVWLNRAVDTRPADGCVNIRAGLGQRAGEG